MGLKEEFKKLLALSDGMSSKGNKLFRNVIILGIIGTVLLLFGNTLLVGQPSYQPSAPAVESGERPSSLSYEEKLARDLEEIISLVSGVGKVRVKIYTVRGPAYEYIYDQNLQNKITDESDQNGGERRIDEEKQEETMVVIKDSSGSERPVIKKEEYPVIEGVLIVAQGAENSGTKYAISRAVSRLLNLPAYKIDILPYERG